jgi:hypothetical protein
LGTYVELALASIIATQFGKKNAQTATNGFLSVENMRTKLQYADTILSSLNLLTEHRAVWVKLIERAGKLATKRNQLAHRRMEIDQERPAGGRI